MRFIMMNYYRLNWLILCVADNKQFSYNNNNITYRFILYFNANNKFDLSPFINKLFSDLFNILIPVGNPYYTYCIIIYFCYCNICCHGNLTIENIL